MKFNEVAQFDGLVGIIPTENDVIIIAKNMIKPRTVECSRRKIEGD